MAISSLGAFLKTRELRGADRSELTDGAVLLPFRAVGSRRAPRDPGQRRVNGGVDGGAGGLCSVDLVGIAVKIYDARRFRRGRAIAAAVMVGVLTLGGLVIAIVSSVA